MLRISSESLGLTSALPYEEACAPRAFSAMTYKPPRCRGKVLSCSSSYQREWYHRCACPPTDALVPPPSSRNASQSAMFFKKKEDVPGGVAVKPWRAGEHARILEPIRHMILPTVLSKRNYHVPALNRMGVSVVELVVAALIIAGVCALGFFQLDAGETDGSGGVAQFLWIPLFALILYRSPIASVLGISFERSMFWHGLFSLIATGYGVHHGVISLYFDDEEGKPGLDAFSGDDSGEYLSGAIASGLMLLTMMTSFAPIRRAMPRIWLWSHHILSLAAAVVCVIHGAPVVLIAVGVYVADRCWGYLLEAHMKNRKAKSESVATVTGDSDLVRITIPRTFSFSPGQYVGLSVPSVSWFEWHNFTIASAPSDSMLVILIKPDGRWTRKLAGKIAKLGGKNGIDVPLPVFMHGPIGSVSIDWTSKEYSGFILFGGGIGVTPVVSFYRELLSQASRGRPVQMARLIYTSRSTEQARSVLQLSTRANPPCVEDDVEIAATPETDYFTPGFQSEVFITSQKGSTGSAASDVGSGFGAVDWHLGRPDIAATFAAAVEEASALGIKRIGVLACGPEPLTDSVMKHARRASGQVKFDVHVEHFY